MHDKMQRLPRLDALRGVAIILVFFFHYYSRWPDIYPYRDDFAAFPLFRFGNEGVDLFFMISGFVIFLTLDNSRSLGEFALRRWIRLFPAMCVATFLIYLTAPFFFERPAGVPRASDAIPGLLFIDPAWLRAIGGHAFGEFEPAFWSLFVEVKFYLVFGLLHRFAGPRRAIRILLALSLAALIYRLLDKGFAFAPAVQSIYGALDSLFILEFLPWFLIGLVAYEIKMRHLDAKPTNRADLLLLFAAAAPLLMSERKHVYTLAILMGLFLYGVFGETGKRFYESRTLLFFGAISYPLYLIHENIGVSIILKAHVLAPWLPGLLLPLPAICFATAVAFAIARLIEPPVQRTLKRLLLRRGEITPAP